MILNSNKIQSVRNQADEKNAGPRDATGKWRPISTNRIKTRTIETREDARATFPRAIARPLNERKSIDTHVTLDEIASKNERDARLARIAERKREKREKRDKKK